MATDIPMNTLEHVTYKGTELNEFSVAGCEWRKPYNLTIPTKPTGVGAISVVRNSSQSNCGQISATTLTASGKVLYGDNITASVTAATGYNNPSIEFTGGTAYDPTRPVTFPAVQSTQTICQTITNGETTYCVYGDKATSTVGGLSNYTKCTIDGIEVSTSYTTIKTNNPVLNTTQIYEAKFSDGTLTLRTRVSVTLTISSSSGVVVQANSYLTTATFAGATNITATVTGDVGIKVTAGAIKYYTLTVVGADTYSYVQSLDGSKIYSSGDTVPYGTKLTLVATAPTGYTTKVKTSDGQIDTSGTTGITVMSDVTITFTRIGKTYYVYYEQGTASSATNLPLSQARIYPNAVTLATNNMTKNSTVVATYTVTYNYQGGSGGNGSASSSKYIDYTANGWTTTSGSTTPYYVSGAEFGANNPINLTLYPCFSQRTSTSPVQLPTPTRDGYTFQGWATSSTATSGTYSGGASYTPTSNVTLYAIWQAIPQLTAPVIVSSYINATDDYIYANEAGIYVQNNNGCGVYYRVTWTGPTGAAIADGPNTGVNVLIPARSSQYLTCITDEAAVTYSVYFIADGYQDSEAVTGSIGDTSSGGEEETTTTTG